MYKKLLKKRFTRRVYFSKKFCNRDDIRRQMSGKKDSVPFVQKRLKNLQEPYLGFILINEKKKVKVQHLQKIKAFFHNTMMI
jgi:hypothetical protein